MLDNTNNQKDFLIVGSGLAACTVAHILHQNNLSFKIISNPNLNSAIITIQCAPCNIIFYTINAL